MEIAIRSAGVLLVALAFLHAAFPRRFDWKNEFASVSLLSRQVMYVHTFFIALTVFLMGVLCISSADMLINTELGRRICLGLAIFWLARLIVQFVGYSSELWKGKRLETAVHIIFSVLWTFLTLIFSLAGLSVGF